MGTRSLGCRKKRAGSSREPFPRDGPVVEPKGVTVARCLEFPYSTGP
jgi:hypothetical protein